MKPNNKTALRTVADLNITEWQELLERYRADRPPSKTLKYSPAAMRIENTPLTTARYTGGCVCNGDHYTYFEPVVPGEKPNPDGSPYVAWLLVRDDFLRWVAKMLREEGKAKK